MSRDITKDIYAPLAHRLGISKVKWELEDLCFRYLHEEEYYDLVHQISEKRVERETYIAQIIKDLYSKLEEAEIDSDIDRSEEHTSELQSDVCSDRKSVV